MTNQNYEVYKKVLGENATKLIRKNYPESLDDLEFLDYISKKCKTKTNTRNVLSNIENLLYVKNDYLNNKKDKEEVKNKKSLDYVLEKSDYEYKIINDVKELLDYKKYYSQDEILCTHNNPKERLNNYHMIVMSKKDFDKIKRSEKPKREDEYSTSLLNVQIHKKFNNVSIKSRYNHTINNPDAVFSNDLNKIARGCLKLSKKD